MVARVHREQGNHKGRPYSGNLEDASCALSRPEPIRELHEAADRDIDRRRRPGLALARAFFVWSRDVGGPQPAGGG